MAELEKIAESVRQAALTAKGVSDRAFRREVYEHAQSVAHDRPAAQKLPAHVAAFVAAVAEHSNDADVEALSKQGLSDDEIFECAVVASVAAGLVRMEEGLRAMRPR